MNIQRREYPGLLGLTSSTLKQLGEYGWPGNVRELQGLIERLSVMKRDGWIGEQDLPPHIDGRPTKLRRVSLPPEGVNFSELVDSFESDLINQALQVTDWNKNQAAQLLGLKRTTLVEKIRSKGMVPENRD